MKTYARYLTQVLNDTQRGQELMARAKEATSGGGNGKTSYLDIDGLDVHNISKFPQPCMMVSGNLEDTGVIICLNQGASRIFGYS
jgi:hypothetical protein